MPNSTETLGKKGLIVITVIFTAVLFSGLILMALGYNESFYSGSSTIRAVFTAITFLGEPIGVIIGVHDLQDVVGGFLVGYPSFVEEPVDNVFLDVPSFNCAQSYNASDTDDCWKHHKEQKLFGNDLVEMKTGFGYWVYVTSDADWDVEY